jgi:hypothetical protein
MNIAILADVQCMDNERSGFTPFITAKLAKDETPAS